MQPETTLLSESTGINECLDRLSRHDHKVRPVSTYRLQFNKHFRFVDAVGLVPYLRNLGITTCYSSPILMAQTGSMHGYDIIDHNLINPEIGTESEFQQLVDALHEHKMDLMLDVVPNHMGVGQGNNPWWQDVLRNGQTSRYSNYFDIDWDPLKPELHSKVLLPILADQYGKVLEDGHFKVTFQDGEFRIEYFETVLPLDPQTYPLIFRAAGEPLAVSDTLRDFLGLLGAFEALPPHEGEDTESAARRQRELPYLQQRLAQVFERSPEVRDFVQSALDRISGNTLEARSFDALHALLEAQPYRLAHWRVSAEEINYRRFFDINDLIGLRMEDPRVFAATQGLIRKLLATGAVAGLRIDHPDGLFNPPQYFTRLQMLYVASQCCGAEPKAPLAENGIELEVQNAFGRYDWSNNKSPLYVVVEKILESGEDLPTEWPVDGTVGYEFANLSTQLFVDRQAKRSFTNLYHRFINESIDVDSLIYSSKKLIMHSSLSSEVNVLSHMLEDISSLDRRARDFTRKSLRDAIRETIACFPVYRTYIDERGNITDRDRHYIEQAIAAAKRRNGSMPAQVFDFFADILLLRRQTDHDALVHGYRKQLYFALKFQQLTGPVMAKGLEDTVCYVYNRFIASNEVGGSPKEFGVDLETFHSAITKRAQGWPYALLTTSTHDTKRSEDVRMRLAVLSEIPRQWAAQVLRWRRINRSRRQRTREGRNVPDLNEEYFLYQTLVGTWPLPRDGNSFELIGEARNAFVQRIQQYMHKAVHEAKINLSWVNDDQAYNDALRKFVNTILLPEVGGKPNAFLRLMHEFLPSIAYFGALNSVAATLLKLTVPGVPDIYQGQELFEYSLVDPDNRRPVNFDLRESLLADLDTAGQAKSPGFCDDLLKNWSDGRMKLWVSACCLRARRAYREVFQEGEYVPLDADGDEREFVMAFARTHRKQSAVIAFPRFAHTMMGGERQMPLGETWKNTLLRGTQELVGRSMVNLLTGETVSFDENGTTLCAEVFRRFPVALLMS